MTDDELMAIVDSYKRKRLNRSESETTEDRYNRYKMYMNKSLNHNSLSCEQL